MKFLSLFSTRHLISEEILKYTAKIGGWQVFLSRIVEFVERKEKRKINKVTVLLSFLSYQNHVSKLS